MQSHSKLWTSLACHLTKGHSKVNRVVFKEHSEGEGEMQTTSLTTLPRINIKQLVLGTQHLKLDFYVCKIASGFHTEIQ
jgi:hypothetical protein